MAARQFDFDALVVGAGAVGLAIGYGLARRDLSVVVIEAERQIGQGVSSRNSEVIHGSLYYPTGSLRARLCAEGRRMLYPFLDAHGVAYNRCGKLVVATDDSQIERLHAIMKQAQINGVEGMAWLTRDEALAMEPEVNCVAALHSPESGVFDSHGYMTALEGAIEHRGGSVVTDAPLISATPLAGGGFAVRTGGSDPAELTVGMLVTSAGLDAQTVAASIEGYPTDQIPKRYLGKGNYFALEGKAPFKMLVYPPPVHGALGVHYRCDLGGQARFGPDLQWIDEIDYQVDPRRADGFYKYIRQFWPGLKDDALVPDYVGIRPKIHGPDQPQPDFQIRGQADHGIAGLVTLFGIESPGLTSSLAIGEDVAKLLGLEELG